MAAANHISRSSVTMTKPYVQSGEPLHEFLHSFWQRQVDAAEQEIPDYRHPPLPLARIKKVMKSDPDVKVPPTQLFSLISFHDPFYPSQMIAADGLSVPSFRPMSFTNLYQRPSYSARHAKVRTLTDSPSSFPQSLADFPVITKKSFHRRDHCTGVHSRRFQQTAHSVPRGHRQGPQQVRPVRLSHRHRPARRALRPRRIWTWEKQESRSGYSQCKGT